MTNVSRKAILGLTLIAAFAGVASSSFAAETHWQKAHPRRTVVNDRLATQNARINQQVANGTMSKSEAHSLRKEGRQIRREERAMASQNGSHLTKAEDRALLQQENARSKEIGR